MSRLSVTNLKPAKGVAGGRVRCPCQPRGLEDINLVQTLLIQSGLAVVAEETSPSSTRCPHCVAHSASNPDHLESVDPVDDIHLQEPASLPTCPNVLGLLLLPTVRQPLLFLPGRGGRAGGRLGLQVGGSLLGGAILANPKS